jgi:predicted Zn-dependent peptidase
MNRYKLNNGLNIIEFKRDSAIVTIQATVKVGSNNETKNNGGISHFLEHIVFEGTKKRTSAEIANSIEGLGGDISAFTSNETTGFFIKIIKKHFEKALEILSDILINPTFTEKAIEQERKIILSEIKMVTDQPRQYQWILFCKALFKKYPAKNPIYGTEQSVNALQRKDLLEYFQKYYTSQNTIISVVGNIPQLKEKIEKYFGKMDSNKVNDSFTEEKLNQRSRLIEKRKINQSYAVLGYKTPKRKESESYVFDVIRAVLGRGLSGKLFRTIRVDNALAYDVGVYHDPNIYYGVFAVYFSTNKKNIQKCIDLTIQEFKKLKDLTDQELIEAKQFIEGEYILNSEDSQDFANLIGSWELASKAEDCTDYVKKIKKVTKQDILRVVNKYLNENYALAVIEQN